MRNQLLVVEKERFFLNDRCKYLIQGVIPEKYTIEAFLDNKKLSVSTKQCVAKSAVERFQDGELLGGQRVEALIELPEDLTGYKMLKAYAVFEKERLEWFHIKTSVLSKKRGKPQFYIEEERVNRKNHSLVLRGWAAGASHVQIRLFDENKNPLSVPVQRNAHGCGRNVPGVPY